jgi:hypothetical protein
VPLVPPLSPSSATATRACKPRRRTSSPATFRRQLASSATTKWLVTSSYVECPHARALIWPQSAD